MGIRAVIFDRDGVLTDFDLDAASSFFLPLVGLTPEQLSERWEEYGQAVGFPSTLSEEAIFFRGFWNHLSEQLALEKEIENQLHAFDYTTCIIAYADARAALQAAKSNHLATGVLSNFSLASLDVSLQATGLADLVDVACAAPVIGYSKPDPEAYYTITRSLGVSAEECLFFDDEMPAVEGARAIGMQAYLVDRQRSTHSLDEGIVSDLSIVSSLLMR